MKRTYNAQHRHIAAARGPASSHACPCGERAADWAYLHNADEVYCNELGRPYSMNLAHYQALCRECHRFLDSLPHVPAKEPVLVLESDPVAPEVRQAASRKAGLAFAERMKGDPELADAMRENSRVNGLAAQQRHLEKLEEDAAYAARSKAASLANLATANQAKAARRAADPEFDARMRAMHQEVGRKVGEAQARMRRKCSQCPLESSPAGVAKHQRTTGHEGWSNA